MCCVMQVVDFSDAQIKGFSMAYAQFFSSDGENKDDLFEEAKSKLKGCNFHFRKSLTGVTRSLEDEDATQFKDTVDSMIQVLDVDGLDALRCQLENQFPDFVPWIRWWTQPRIAVLLFRAYQTMDKDVWASLPDTTNAVESLHQSLRAHSGTKPLSEMDAISRLYDFSQLLKKQYDSVTGTLSTRHH